MLNLLSPYSLLIFLQICFQLFVSIRVDQAKFLRCGRPTPGGGGMLPGYSKARMSDVARTHTYIPSNLCTHAIPCTEVEKSAQMQFVSATVRECFDLPEVFYSGTYTALQVRDARGAEQPRHPRWPTFRGPFFPLINLRPWTGFTDDQRFRSRYPIYWRRVCAHTALPGFHTKLTERVHSQARRIRIVEGNVLLLFSAPA